MLVSCSVNVPVLLVFRKMCRPLCLAILCSIKLVSDFVSKIQAQECSTHIASFSPLFCFCNLASLSVEPSYRSLLWSPPHILLLLYHTPPRPPPSLGSSFAPSNHSLFTNVLLFLCTILIIRPWHVQRRIDHLRDGLNFRAQLLLNTMKIETILVGD